MTPEEKVRLALDEIRKEKNEPVKIVSMDPWYLSKRNYATAIMIIVSCATLFNLELEAGFQEHMMEILTAIGLLIGTVVNILSKYRERQKAKK